MRSHLRELLTRAVEKTAKGGELNSSELPPLLLEPPKQREFGDLSTLLLEKFTQVRGIRSMNPSIFVDIIKYQFDVAPIEPGN